jgi:hypothetical protein
MAEVIAVLAHQGGWDEVLLVGGPIVVIAVILAIAKRRVDALPGASSTTTDAPDDPGD